MSRLFKAVTLTFIIGVSNINPCVSQRNFLDHKVDIGIRIGFSSGIEKESYTKSNFTSPSFLNHMQSGYTGEAFINLKVLNFMGIYGGVNTTNFSEWEVSEENNIYEGSTCQFQDFKPGISFFTPFRYNGFLNKANVNLSIGPLFSQFTLNYGNVFQHQPTATTGTIGAFAIASINYSLSQNSFLTLSYAFNHLKNSSDLSIQDSYQYHSINVGLGFQLFKNKNYLYE